MDGIQVLYEEHENVLIFTKVVDRLCCNILQGQEVPVEKLRHCVEFIKEYADKHHHGKEEEILFRYMMEELSPVAEKLIRHGMLVEHDLGRYHVGELSKALDVYQADPSVENKLEILRHSLGYADLLRRHAAKENMAAFAFAERSLSEEIRQKINQETEKFEQEAAQKGIQKKYLDWLKEMALEYDIS